jgi:very-short-patch-repair endonuclease
MSQNLVKIRMNNSVDTTFELAPPVGFMYDFAFIKSLDIAEIFGSESSGEYYIYRDDKMHGSDNNVKGASVVPPLLIQSKSNNLTDGTIVKIGKFEVKKVIKWKNSKDMPYKYSIHGIPHFYDDIVKDEQTQKWQIDVDQKLLNQLKGRNSVVPSYLRHLVSKYEIKIPDNSIENVNEPQHGIMYTKDSTLEEYLQRARDLHGNKYDYSLIKKEDITNDLSTKVNIICIVCTCKWIITLGVHIMIKVMGGCPECRRRSCNPTEGEKRCMIHLNILQIKYEWEWRLPSVEKYFYDFIFEYNGKGYVLEYDGKQHFEYSPYFHKSEQLFNSEQNKDIDKSKAIISEGYYLIRIDYTQINNIAHHINKALQILNNQNRVYYSTPQMYIHISKQL